MVKQGANIEFIATYLFNNPGASGAEVRRELCKARGIDPGRFKHLWHSPTNEDGFYLTQRGLERVQT